MIIEGLLARSIQMSTPLIIGALAEVLVERTGVMNIAIEGIFFWAHGPDLSVLISLEAT